jgi:hypothetical protein
MLLGCKNNPKPIYHNAKNNDTLNYTPKIDSISNTLCLNILNSLSPDSLYSKFIWQKITTRCEHDNLFDYIDKIYFIENYNIKNFNKVKLLKIELNGKQPSVIGNTHLIIYNTNAYTNLEGDRIMTYPISKMEHLLFVERVRRGHLTLDLVQQKNSKIIVNSKNIFDTSNITGDDIYDEYDESDYFKIKKIIKSGDKIKVWVNYKVYNSTTNKSKIIESITEYSL